MTETAKPPASPECEKLVSVSPKSQPIGEFIDWLQQEKGLVIARWIRHNEDGSERIDPRLVPAQLSTQDLLAEYFEIDMAKVEKERRALLEFSREHHRAYAGEEPRG